MNNYEMIGGIPSIFSTHSFHTSSDGTYEFIIYFSSARE